ncbi:MAG: HAD family phosphatase [Ignavibacteriae bacterium]|nr:HAD family phosphatase [Ignavibacteriota bacterium]
MIHNSIGAFLFSFLSSDKRFLARLKHIRLVASDLDGTLLNDENGIGPESVRAIRELNSHGVALLLASGRSDGFIRHFSRALGSPHPIVSLNGALIKDASGIVLWQSLLGMEVGARIAEIMRRHPEMDVAAFTGDGVHATGDPSELPRYLAAYPPEQRVVQDLLPLLDRAVMCVARGSYSAIQDLSVGLAKDFHTRVDRSMYQSKSAENTYFLEIRNSGVHKGTALRFLARHLGLRPREVAAIGDYSNDVEMLKFAGVAAAMRNGIEQVKRHADFVTRATSSEDGAAEFFALIASAREPHT